LNDHSITPALQTKDIETEILVALQRRGHFKLKHNNVIEVCLKEFAYQIGWPLKLIKGSRSQEEYIRVTE
jgi:hypothetical protein